MASAKQDRRKPYPSKPGIGARPSHVSQDTCEILSDVTEYYSTAGRDAPFLPEHHSRLVRDEVVDVNSNPVTDCSGTQARRHGRPSRAGQHGPVLQFVYRGRMRNKSWKYRTQGGITRTSARVLEGTPMEESCSCVRNLWRIFEAQPSENGGESWANVGIVLHVNENRIAVTVYYVCQYPTFLTLSNQTD